MNVTIFNPSTGQILRTCSVPVGFASMQCGPGEDWIEGVFPDDRYYVEAYTPAPIPEQPSNHHRFDFATKQWVDPRTIQDHKQTKWSEIKSARSAAEFGGFTWDGSTFDSDQISQSRIQGAAQLAQLALAQSQPFTIDWTLADNTTRTLDAMQMIQVGVAMGQHIATCHAQARVLRAQLDAAATVEDVDAIAWG